MTSTRRAFTLLEVLVALVLTGMLSAMAYTTLQTGIDTSDRLGVRRDREEALATARGLVGQALRHAVPGVTGGPATFDVVRRIASDGTRADSMTFVTRGIVEPWGASASWRASLWTAHDTLHLNAIPIGEAGVPVTAAIAGVRGLGVRALGRGTFAAWEDGWSDPSVAPAAVAITYIGTAGVPTPQVQRVGLERVP